MHSYLIIGSKDNQEKEIERLSQKLKTTIMEFELQKIDDSRALGNFVKLHINSPTAIKIENIETSNTESLNAFLKILEEPQENLYFFLCAKNTASVLPTIVSRSQVVNVGREKSKSNEKIVEFIKMETPSKLAYLDKLKGREEGIEFVDNFIEACHSMLIKTDTKHDKVAKAIEDATNCLNALKQNGNVNIQLTNFVVCLAN